MTREQPIAGCVIVQSIVRHVCYAPAVTRARAYARQTTCMRIDLPGKFTIFRPSVFTRRGVVFPRQLPD